MSKYISQRDEKNLTRLQQILHDDLPAFCEAFFIGIEQTTTTLTRLNYAYDLRTFFKFLTTNVRRFEEKQTYDIRLADLESILQYN